MTISVAAFAPTDDDTFRAAYDVVVRSARADTPEFPAVDRRGYRSALDATLPGRRLEHVVARRQDRVVGVLHLEFPEQDNLETVHVDRLVVDPEHRRLGVGRALHAHAVARTRALGRDKLIGSSLATTPDGAAAPGAAFAAGLGAHGARAETRHRLVVAALDPARLDALVAGALAEAAGYRPVYWESTTPEELIADAAYLFGRMGSDSPAGDLASEALNLDAEQIRQFDASTRARGRLPFHAGAVHADSGRLVAWTTLVTRADLSWHAWQSLTIVEPRHRGHRLGLLVKAANLRRIRAACPDLRAVDTYTAAANTHMNAVNTALGFQPRESWTTWQQTL